MEREYTCEYYVGDSYGEFNFFSSHRNGSNANKMDAIKKGKKMFGHNIEIYRIYLK